MGLGSDMLNWARNPIGSEPDTWEKLAKRKATLTELGSDRIKEDGSERRHEDGSDRSM